MINHKKVSLIIPVKNEENAVLKMFKSMPSLIDEVIVVDNNSADKTGVIARSYGAKVVKEPKRDRFGIGYGFAHQTGIKRAKGDLIVAMDGDGTYPLVEIKEVIKYMERENLDFVSCRRFPLRKKAVISKIRQFGVWILNTQVRRLYKYPIGDILSGMWVVRKSTAKTLNLKEGGWDFSPEIKLEAITNKEIKFGEYHIDHNYRLDEKSKQKIFQTGFNHFRYILKRWLSQDGQFTQAYKLLTKDITISIEGRLPKIALR